MTLCGKCVRKEDIEKGSSNFFCYRNRKTQMAIAIVVLARERGQHVLWSRYTGSGNSQIFMG